MRQDIQAVQGALPQEARFEGPDNGFSDQGFVASGFPDPLLGVRDVFPYGFGSQVIRYVSSEETLFFVGTKQRPALKLGDPGIPLPKSLPYDRVVPASSPLPFQESPALRGSFRSARRPFVIGPRTFGPAAERGLQAFHVLARLNPQNRYWGAGFPRDRAQIFFIECLVALSERAREIPRGKRNAMLPAKCPGLLHDRIRSPLDRGQRDSVIRGSSHGAGWVRRC